MTRVGKIALGLGLALALVVGLLAGVYRIQIARAIGTVAVTVTPDTAGDVADYTITFQHAAAGTAGMVITVTFPSGTTVPSSIDTTRVLVGAGATAAAALAAATVNPIAVTVTGRAVGVQLPALTGFAPNQFIAVRFTQAAGIRNPQVSNNYTLNVASSAFGEPPATSPAYTINDVVEISPTHAPQGGTITVSGRGFSPGATIRVTGGPASGSGTVAADGTFSFTAVRTGAPAAPVTVTDGTGRTATTAVVLTLDPSLTATPTSGKAQDRIRLRGINFGAGSNIPGPGGVTFGGTPMVAANVIPVNPAGFGQPFVDLDLDGNADDFDLDIRIPGNQPPGTYEVVVTDAGGNRATTNISVTGRSVSLTPASGPPGTTVTVSGHNFPANVAAAPGNFVRAEVYLSSPPVVIGAPVTGLETDALGNVLATFTIPPMAPIGPITIRVRIVAADGTNSDGTATFTVTASSTGTGLLRVETQPASQIQIWANGLLLDEWGVDWPSFPVGEYLLEFRNPPYSWNASSTILVRMHPPGGAFTEQPVTQPVRIEDGKVTEVILRLWQNGFLRVTTEGAAGPTIAINGTPRDAWQVWTTVPPGTYTVSFLPLPNATTPCTRVVTVVSGSGTRVHGNYTTGSCDIVPYP